VASFEVARDPAHIDAHVADVRPAQLLKPLPEHRNVALSCGVGFGEVNEHADAPHPLALLRARRKRPCSRRAAEQREELAPFHSITSSAMLSSEGGTVRPSACAVIKLTTSSNFVGCSTGISPGFVPRRILST